MLSVSSITDTVTTTSAGQMSQMQQTLTAETARWTSMSSVQQYAAVFGTAPSHELAVNSRNPNNTVVDTPGYTVNVSNSGDGSITATNKTTGAVTKVWGDPHISANGQEVGTFTGNRVLSLPDGTTIDVKTTPEANGVSYIDSATVNSPDGNSSVTVGNVHGKGPLQVQQANAAGIGAFENAQNGGADLLVDSSGNVSTENGSGTMAQLSAGDQTTDNAILSYQDLQEAQAAVQNAQVSMAAAQMLQTMNLEMNSPGNSGQNGLMFTQMAMLSMMG